MKKILLSVFTIFAVVAVVAGGTAALFSDQGSVAGNTVGTGTLELTLNESAGKPFEVENAYPGWESDTEWVDIFNGPYPPGPGQLPFEAEMSFANTGGSSALYDWLTIELWTSGYDSDCSNGDGGENTIYSGLIKDFTTGGLPVSDSSFWHLANEDDASGGPDNIRPGYSERVCQKIGVHVDADNSVQGVSTTFDEIVDALQDND